jgi:hypothetical protein
MQTVCYIAPRAACSMLGSTPCRVQHLYVWMKAASKCHQFSAYALAKCSSLVTGRGNRKDPRGLTAPSVTALRTVCHAAGLPPLARRPAAVGWVHTKHTSRKIQFVSLTVLSVCQFVSCQLDSVTG